MWIIFPRTSCLGQRYSLVCKDVNFLSDLRLGSYSTRIYAASIRGSLKEDAPVDASSAAMTSSQILFMWILIGLLVAWMSTFAVLAFRSGETKKLEVEEYVVTYDSTTAPSASPLARVEVR